MASLQPIAASLPAGTSSTSLTKPSTLPTKPNAERQKAGLKALKALLVGRPETNAENPSYLQEMVEVLAYLTDEELAILTHARTGLQTTLKFLPTPADVHAFLRDARARMEAVRPAPTNYRKLHPDDPKAPWNAPAETDAERKKRVVREYLGYDPDRAPARALEKPSESDLQQVLSNLKTPAGPVSPQLRSALAAEGWPFLPPE